MLLLHTCDHRGAAWRHLYLTRPIELRKKHSGLRFVAYPKEKPTVSGGVELKSLEWKAYNVSGSSNIWVADLNGQVDEVPGLQIDGVRDARAAICRAASRSHPATTR